MQCGQSDGLGCGAPAASLPGSDLERMRVRGSAMRGKEAGVCTAGWGGLATGLHMSTAVSLPNDLEIAC